MTENATSSGIRGTLYVLGGFCSFVAANIFMPHDWRGWIAFSCGLIGNTCILWRAYIDKSHARYAPDKLITGPLDPVALDGETVVASESTTKTTTVAATTTKPHEERSV
jgi:hypothetical protein